MSDLKPSRLRDIFWPIYGDENWKFIPMLGMMTLALFIYTTLRIHKDAYILSAELSSAITISFLKAYLVLPFSIIYMMMFYALINQFSKERVFIIALMPFFLFFVFFYLVLLPNTSSLHMSVESICFYQEKFPAFRNFVPVVAYWVFSLYYVFSELWGTVVISFLFWGFASYAVTVEQTKRFYVLFASYSYFGLVLAAKIQSYIYKYSSYYQKGSKEYLNVIFINCYFVVFSILMFLFLYWFVNHRVLPFEKNGLFKEMKMAPKFKPSLFESLSTIVKSKYLLYIAVIVICYGITSNLLEITWKELVRRELNGVEAEIGKYMSEFYFATGICTIFFGMVNRYFSNKFGWLSSSLFTPIFVFFSSFIFFSLIIFGNYFGFLSCLGYSGSCYFAMQLGFFQDIIIKGCKYGVLDPNIQSSYVPLGDELKTKGKAAVDIVGAKFGKSSASFLESNLSMFFNGADQIDLAPIFMPIVAVFCLIWIFCTVRLANAYKVLLKIKR